MYSSSLYSTSALFFPPQASPGFAHLAGGKRQPPPDRRTASQSPRNLWRAIAHRSGHLLSRRARGRLARLPRLGLSRRGGSRPPLSLARGQPLCHPGSRLFRRAHHDQMEVGAGRAPARQGFRRKRERRLLLAGLGTLALHPPLRDLSRRPLRFGSRAYIGAPAAVSVHFGLSATLCNGCTFQARNAPGGRAAPRLSMKTIQVKEHGGPEKLELVDVPKPAPGPRQALVKIAASGVNFIDVYFRTGLYKAELPITLGSEGAGTVESVGPDVTEVAPGDRVAYAMARGSYAEYAVVPSAQLVKIPAGVDFQQAAAAMLQGMTAHYLTHSTFPLKQGDTCLVHAAAGGVGLLLVQMARRIGADVFGTVSTEAKAELARGAGAQEIILYTQQDFETEVRRLTGGR